MDAIRVNVRTSLIFKDIFGKWRFEVDLPAGSTFRDFIHSLVEEWGDPLTAHLFQSDGKTLSAHVMFMINGRNIKFLDNLETVLEHDDGILILPPVGGG